VLYGFYVVNFVAFHGDAMRELAEQFSTLAEKQGATVPIMIGHRLTGHALLLTGEIAAAQAHYSQGLALYDPPEHRPFATRFGQDISVTILGFRSLALWLLGYPEKALADASRALKDAQEIGQAATLMFALNYTAKTQTHCGNYAAANSLLEQLIALADQKGRPVLEGLRYVRAGLCAGREWRHFRRRPSAHIRNDCTALNGRNTVCAVASLELGKGPRGPGQTR
jgi:tetratricopeptide (TPR) repeat protein